MSQNYLETTHQSVNWFRSARDSEQLEIAPSFQRRPVWSQRQKSDLIGTILLGYPVPELYVHEIVSADGEERHRLVDGQQRIRAVLEFVDGEFDLVESSSVPQGYHSKSFDDLESEAQRRIRSYKFVIRTLKEVDDVVVRDMFKRLNQGVVSLNDQELRHATYDGDFLELVEQIADSPTWSEFGIFSAEDVRRMRDVEYVSELAIAALNGPQNKKLSLDKWYQAYEEEFSEKASLQVTFDTVLSQIRQALPELKKTRWRKRSDFYTLFSVMARIEDELPLGQEQSQALARALTDFGSSVDAAVRITNEATIGEEFESPDQSFVNDPVVPILEDVSRYADAVERAATDLSRRRVREAILLTIVEEALS